MGQLRLTCVAAWRQNAGIRFNYLSDMYQE